MVGAKHGPVPFSFFGLSLITVATFKFDFLIFAAAVIYLLSIPLLPELLDFINDFLVLNLPFALEIIIPLG